MSASLALPPSAAPTPSAAAAAWHSLALTELERLEMLGPQTACWAHAAAWALQGVTMLLRPLLLHTGPFHLGSFSIVIGWIAVVWAVFMTVRADCFAACPRHMRGSGAASQRDREVGAIATVP